MFSLLFCDTNSICMALGFCDGEGRTQNFMILSKLVVIPFCPKHDLEQIDSLLCIYSLKVLISREGKKKPDNSALFGGFFFLWMFGLLNQIVWYFRYIK